jgi:hypothetical protein
VPLLALLLTPLLHFQTRSHHSLSPLKLTFIISHHLYFSRLPLFLLPQLAGSKLVFAFASPERFDTDTGISGKPGTHNEKKWTNDQIASDWLGEGLEGNKALSYYQILLFALK